MKISDNGIEFIKSHEGLMLTGYRDPIGIPTIGWGHTATAIVGKKITSSQAEELLRSDVSKAEHAVSVYTTGVGVNLSQNQYDALVSLVFNVGSHNIFTKNYSNGYPQGSTLYNKLLQGDYDAVAERFNDFKKAGGKVLPGLVRRRKEESELFKKKTELCPSCCRPL